MMKYILALFVAVAAVAAYSVEIVKNSTAVAEIIVPDAAPPPVALAASELKKWIREISGAELAVVRQRTPGKNAIALSVNPELASTIEVDGYAVSEADGVIKVEGAMPRGVLNGVYRLLFLNTDIIWARPNEEFGTVFTKNANLDFKNVSFRRSPSFLMRGVQMTTVKYQTGELWLVRNGNNWSVRMTIRGKQQRQFFDNGFTHAGAHNLVRLYMPEQKYWKNNPEFYALIKGKRKDPSTDIHKTNLCFTNGECLKEFQKNFMAEVEAHMDCDIIGINQEDTLDACGCRECMKPITLPDGRKVMPKDKNFRSTQFFLWLNETARLLKSKYPNKSITTLAYYLTEPAPACKVEKNIIVNFAPVFKDSKHPLYAPENRETLEKYRGWINSGCNITWREYYGLTKDFPRPIDRIAFADWLYVQKDGVRRTRFEMPPDLTGSLLSERYAQESWDQNSMYFWVLANSTFDTSRSFPEYRKEFLKRVYGDAAEDVGRYYTLLENAWLKSPGKSLWDDDARASWMKCLKNPGLKEQLAETLKKAAGKKMPENGRKHLERLTASFEKMSSDKLLSIRAVKTDTVPEFDPDFKSGAWAKAIEYSNFHTFSPGEEKTSLRVLAGEKALYIGVKCFDARGKNIPAATLTPYRDKWLPADKFEFLFRTADGKLLQAAIDSNGNVFDRLNKNNAYEYFFNVPVRKTDDGWSLMLTVPYEMLGYGSKPESVQAYFMRYHRKRNRTVHAKYGHWYISNKAPEFYPIISIE